MLCECGAPARGHVCQRGHRLEEDWSGYDAKRKGHSASSVIDALNRVGELAQHEGEIEYHTHPSVRGKAAPHCKTHGYLDVAGNPSSGPRFLPSKEARQIAAKHIRQSHMNEAWSPQARAAAIAARRGKKVWMHPETGHQFHEGDEVHLPASPTGKGRIKALVQTADGPKVRVSAPHGEFHVEPDSLRRPLQEAWSPQARAAAIAARERNKPAGSFNVGDRVVHDAGGNTGVIAAKRANAVHVAPDDPGSVDWGAIEHGSVGGKRTLLYGHDAPMQAFKPRPPQELQQRGR